MLFRSGNGPADGLGSEQTRAHHFTDAQGQGMALGRNDPRRERQAPAAQMPGPQRPKQHPDGDFVGDIKEFLRMINECEEIALATSIHDFPNVRIVNYYYDEKNNVMYFATYTGREKISEFWKNNNVSFTTIPMNRGKREHIRARGHVRKSEKSILDDRDRKSVV